MKNRIFYIISLSIILCYGVYAQENIPDLVKVGNSFDDIYTRYKYGIYGQMAIGDIDNDGIDEIVIPASKYHTKDNRLAGYGSILLGLDYGIDSFYRFAVVLERPYQFYGIVLGNIDADPELEIISLIRDSSPPNVFKKPDLLRAYNHDGTLIFSKEFSANGLNVLLGILIYPSKKQDKILAVITNEDARTSKLVMYHGDGTLYENFNSNIAISYQHSIKIAVGDLLPERSGDEIVAILCKALDETGRLCTEELYVLYSDGSIASNFPLNLGDYDRNRIFDDLRLGDINNDDNIDIVFLEEKRFHEGLSTHTIEKKINAIDARSGTYLSQIVFSEPNEKSLQIPVYPHDLILGDIDGDNKLEAVHKMIYENIDEKGEPVDYSYAELQAINFDTGEIDKSIQFDRLLAWKFTIENELSLTDVNNDGVLDIIMNIEGDSVHAFNKDEDEGLRIIDGWPKKILNKDLNPDNIDVFGQGESIGDLYSSSVLAGDIDGNGKADLIIPHRLNRPPALGHPPELSGDQFYFYNILNLGENDHVNGWYQYQHDYRRSATIPADKYLFIRGDANLDKKTDISDALSILQFLFAGRTIECEDLADINDNGRLDITDAIYLLNYLFRGGNFPLPPFPEEGFDPTADELNCNS